MTDDPSAVPGGLTPEDRRLMTRFAAVCLAIEGTLILLAGWYGGVKWAVILAVVLILGVGYGLVGMRRELLRRHQQGPDA